MVKQLSKVAKHLLKLEDALKAYAALKETPEFFRWYIERYARMPRSAAPSHGTDEVSASISSRPAPASELHPVNIMATSSSARIVPSILATAA